MSSWQVGSQCTFVNRGMLWGNAKSWECLGSAEGHLNGVLRRISSLYSFQPAWRGSARFGSGGWSSRGSGKHACLLCSGAQCHVAWCRWQVQGPCASLQQRALEQGIKWCGEANAWVVDMDAEPQGVCQVELESVADLLPNSLATIRYRYLQWEPCRQRCRVQWRSQQDARQSRSLPCASQRREDVKAALLLAKECRAELLEKGVLRSADDKHRPVSYVKYDRRRGVHRVQFRQRQPRQKTHKAESAREPLAPQRRITQR